MGVVVTIRFQGHVKLYQIVYAERLATDLELYYGENTKNEKKSIRSRCKLKFCLSTLIWVFHSYLRTGIFLSSKHLVSVTVTCLSEQLDIFGLNASEFNHDITEFDLPSQAFPVFVVI